MPVVYRFHSLTGRLLGASARKAYNPQAFRAIEEMPVTRMTASEGPAQVRTVASMKTPVEATPVIKQDEILGTFPDTPAYRRVQEWQRIMTKPDGKMVWQKLPRDVIMYKLTMAFCGLGFLVFAQTMYQMVYPKPKEN